MSLVLNVSGLSVRYGDRVVSTIPSLTIEPGEVVAIVGESGSGKSTALMAILGLLSGTAARVEGSVMVLGTEVVGANEHVLRGLRGSHMALIMQSPQASLNPTTRLGRLLRRTLKLHGVSASEAEERIADATRAVGLDQTLLNRYPHQISGGQAQRFAIALAVCLGAELIAADEPTSALDATVQLEVLALVRRLAQERRVAWLLVAHDLALVSMIADHVLVMCNGEVVESGSARTVLANPQHQYTQALLSASLTPHPG
ncbi:MULTISPECIES: ABC transporter ATP-binding protein [unclassified Mycolicibacterium]|uniref:ABC transporter ATP-binding protein n=1 Tax=unclassified Mycolicibacterium TaxID=2636767 RepID=UPI002ED92548